MGNKMCVIRRNAVADRFTRPRRLLRQPSDVDYKKLRKLILSQKLAPCFDAVEELDRDLEECPICFLYYPSLNRSRCCAKGICTECFLQMKPRHTARPAQCPFCKTSGYAVEYTGARSEEEKSLEQAEEQKVIEAKIRMQSESQIVDWVMPVNQPRTLLDSLHPLPDMEGLSVEQAEDPDAELGGSGVEKSTNMCQSRHRKHDLDLEEIMVMEAIWKSLQDSSVQLSESSGISSQNHQKNFSNFAIAEDVAVAIAILTEQDRMKQAVPDPNSGRRQIDLSPCENFVNDSSIQRETGCSSGSSCLNTLKRPCKFEIDRSGGGGKRRSQGEGRGCAAGG